MTLSSLNDQLTTSQLYPDHVRVIYRYNLPPCPQQTIASVLGRRGFRTESRFHGWRANLDRGNSCNPITVVARRAGPTVGFTVFINVLSLLHRSETRDFGEECSSDKVDNWLHRDAFEDNTP